VSVLPWRQHPIWGQYPNWPDAIDDVSKEKAQKLLEAIPDRFGNLVPPDRFREWSDERFNYVLARAMALQLSTRMRNSPGYEANRRALVLALQCGDGDPHSLLRAVGLNETDLRADLLAFDVGQREPYGFYFGGGVLSDSLSNAVVNDLVLRDRDPELTRILSPVVESMEVGDASATSDYPAPEHVTYPEFESYPLGGWGLFSYAAPFGSCPNYVGFDSLTKDSSTFKDMCQALRG